MMILYLILGLIGIFILFGIIGTIQEKNNPNINQYSKKENNKSSQTLPTVEQLVNNVKTIEDFKKLRTAFNRAEKSYENSQTDNPKIEKKYRIYDDAFWKASDKTLYWQFVPDLDINMPKDKIENAYKIIPISEFEAKRDEIGGTEYEWVEISASEFIDKEFETKPIYFNSLLKFQKIASNNEISYEKKIQLINNFGKTNKPFVDEFFYGIKPTELGNEWIKETLKKYGVPMVDRIYELGYTTPKKVTKIDIDKMKSINGFGEKKIEQLKRAIEKIKTTHNTSYNQ